jgi:hypothetical protein
METFGHVKTVIAIILGLSITHLLKGAAKLIQHPGRDKPYWIHLLWALYVFLLLVHFWWWEYHLNSIQRWVFPEYFFVITYITIYYVLCALLFPDDLRDYKGGFEEYFYSRKKWFFSVLALSFVADVVDTLIKGKPISCNSGWNTRCAMFRIYCCAWQHCGLKTNGFMPRW